MIDIHLVVDFVRAAHWMSIQILGAAALPALAAGFVISMLRAATSTTDASVIADCRCAAGDRPGS